MTPLSQKIADDLKIAMKARDSIRMSCLRMLKTSLKNRQVEEGRELEDGEVQAVISSVIKKGKEAAEEFRRGGRGDLADKEEEEIKVFYEYLPKQLTEAEIEKHLKEIIDELSVNNVRDLGKVMKVAMSRMGGKAPGKEINEIARKLLS
jgi:uncharacterized protein YqeY